MKGSSLHLVVLLSVITPGLPWVSLDGFAQPRDKCARERLVAEKHYLEGRFDEAVALLQPCLERGDLFVEEAVQIYRLISLAYLNTGDLEKARQAVRDLLLHAPSYQPDPIQDPPSYSTMVAVVRQALAGQELPEVQSEEAEEAPQKARPEQEAPVQQPRPVLEPPVDAPVAAPVVSPASSQRRGVLRTPRSWLLATGGALVVAAAVALAFGPTSESSPAPPR